MCKSRDDTSDQKSSVQEAELLTQVVVEPHEYGVGQSYKTFKYFFSRALGLGLI